MNDPVVCAALGDLYYATNGAGWNNNGGWNSAAAGVPTDYCTFFVNGGNKICNTDGDVAQLWLFNNHLIGTLPSSLGNISTLGCLAIDTNNHVGGTIPSSLGNLTSLWNLNLEGNDLIGTIPDSLISLTQSLWLNLGENQLTGMLPSWVGIMKLVYLGLGNNNLSGSMPSTLSSLTSLSYLYLSNSGLCGSVPIALPTFNDGGVLPPCPSPEKMTLTDRGSSRS